MMRLVALLVLACPLSAVKTSSKDALDIELDAEAEAMERPVMKVVKLLTDMKKQLDGEMKTDKDLHEKMDCWCETNSKEKTDAITEGDANIKRLKAFLSGSAGKIAELQVKRTETKEELAADQKALSEATALRMKETKAFAKDEKDTIEALAAVKNAIKVLAKHNTGLVEVQAVASKLRNTNILQFGFVDNLKRAALKDFLSDAKDATSFLSIPGYKSYGSQSGQIFGILNQMQDDFESHLIMIRGEEKKAADEFKELKAAKEDEISDGKKELTNTDEALGNTGEKAAQAEKDLKQAKEQLVNDKKALININKKCKDLDTEYDERVKDRLTELSAVEKAIATLNDEDSFKVFDKTLSFLQTSSTEAEKMQLMRQTAARALERTAAEVQSPILAMLAGRVRLDTFTEVKKSIAKMVAQLEKQQKDEIEHKAWCDKETNDNTKDTAAANDKNDLLTTKTASLKKSVETLTKEIETATAEVAEIKLQMKKSSETREAANKDYQQTITDQRLTQMILSKAITTLKQVYALVQTAHSRSAGSRAKVGAAPEFKKYAKNAGGAQVVKLLEDILTDSKKSEADAIKAEINAQKTYESFMIDANKSLKSKTETIMTKSGHRAKAKEDLIAASEDLAATKKKVSDLASELDDLKKSCDFVVKNFKLRQDARRAEADALKEAAAILSGTK
jgi:hypothetical protein